MKKFISTTILLPTKNHEKKISLNFEKLIYYMDHNFVNYEIMIISNGSNLKNIELLNDSKFSNKKVTIKKLNNAGKGNAIRVGLKNAKYKNIIIFDSDFTYKLNNISYLFKDESPLGPFVYAERILNINIYSSIPKLRIIAGKLFNLIVRKYLKLEIKDSQAGLKLINLEKFKTATEFIDNGYLYDVELFLLAKKENIDVKKVEIFDLNFNRDTNVKLIYDSISMFIKLKKIKKNYKK